MIRRLIIDGYSLLYRDPALRHLRPHDLRHAREQLIRKIDRLAHAIAQRVEIVFDGRTASSERHQAGRLQLIYSPESKTADTVIEQMVHEDPAPHEIYVVTADTLERNTVTAADAQAMSCISFLEWLDRLDSDVTRQQKKTTPPRFTLGEKFPDGLS